MTFRNGAYEAKGFDNWQTPKYFLEGIRRSYGEYFDPCPPNPTFDGLAIDWPLDKPVFVNPPYGDIKTWAKKCAEQSNRGVFVLLLIPARTCTAYFHDYILPYADIEFIRGRIKFEHPLTGTGKTAPFPSILCRYHCAPEVVR